MNSENPLVSILFVTFNNAADLGECLRSLYLQTYTNFEIVIVDNGSECEMVEFLGSLDSRIKCIITGTNNGFGKGNNIGIKECASELIVFSNYDTVYDLNWLETLVETAKSSDEIGIVAPKISYFNDQMRINTCGLFFNYLGYACSENVSPKVDDITGQKEIATASGCCFMIKKDLLNVVGGFDEEYHRFGPDFFFSSLEDIDLCWRVRLVGKKVVFVPKAKMYHKYVKKELSVLRYLYLECGRYYILLKNYEFLTLVILSPVIIFFEALTWVFALLKGPLFLQAKTKSYFILIEKLGILKQKREELKKMRIVNDSVIISKMGSFVRLRHVQLPKFLLKFVEIGLDLIFMSYKKVATVLILIFKKK